LEAKSEEKIEIEISADPNGNMIIFKNPSVETDFEMGPNLILYTYKNQNEMFLLLSSLGQINCIYHFGAAHTSNWLKEFSQHVKVTYYDAWENRNADPATLKPENPSKTEQY